MANTVSEDALQHFDNGMNFEHKGQRKRAIAELKMAIALAPNFASAFHYLGIIYHQQKNYPEGEKAYRQALEIEPSNLDILSNLCRVCETQDHWDEALTIAERMLNLQPGNILTRKCIARSFAHKGLWNEAYDAVAALIKEQPQDADLHLLKGYVCSNMQKMTESEEEYKYAIECDPTWLESYVELAEFYSMTKRRRSVAKTGWRAIRQMATGKFRC